MTATFTSIVEPLPSTVPFVGPEHQERQRGVPFKARIGANESVFGPSPAAVEAMHRAAPEAWMYCDPNMHDLRMAIAAHHSIDPASIVIGEGIDGLFGYTNRLFVEHGDKVVTSLGAYPTFNFHVAGYGGELITVPFVEDHEDPDSLISAAERHRPKLIYMSNPDNPMGTWHSADTISTMIERVPEGSLLCLDEAYIEFAPDGTAPALDTTDKRVIRFRTFSKAYGMAGMRIAYAITHPDIALAFDRIRNHFGVSRIAQEAAIAALKDAEHLARVVRKVATARQRIADIAKANGLTTLTSATNFVAMDCGQNGDFARRVLGGLLERDIFIRMPGVAPQDRCIRIGAGREEDMNLLSKELPKVLSEAELS